MRKELLSITDKVFLSVILILSAITRLWNLGSVPFMHDEFSALSRTAFDTFSELIREGIVIDAHPAGTQVFLYYMVKIFGWNEFYLKLPFALMGVASVYLVFKIGQQWFNTHVGLISAAFVTVSELFVLHSQLIRPYSSGLFFVLLFVYYWNRLLFIDEKISLRTCIGFALSAFLCSQMHNFSLAQAGLIYLSGLLFLKKDDKSRLKAYLLSGIAALILFLPTSFIFYHQIFVNGGIGGWLAMPEPTFIIDFFRYSLNYSQLFIFMSIIIMAYPFLSNKINKDKKTLLRIVGIALFVIPFVLAFVYSKFKEPILQFSTLIFSLPFLIIALFSFYDDKKTNILEKSIIVGSILFIGSTSLIIDRQYYKQVYNQGFDQIAVEMKKDLDLYADSISFVSISNRSLMPKFYQDKEGVDNNKFYDKATDISEYQEYLTNLDTKYIGIGLTDYAEISYEMLALMFYPNIIKECQWFNSKYLLLSKDGCNEKMILKKSDATIPEGYEWGCSFEMDINEIQNPHNIGFIAEIQSTDTITELVFIVELRDKNDDSVIQWLGKDIKDEILLPNEKHYITNGFYFDNKKYNQNDVKINVYLWNRSKKRLNIDNIFLYNSEKSPYFLGLYRPLN